MFTHIKKNTFFLLVILITVSAFFRFYNLNWGAPFYFHPDERNIASSVSQLKFPAQMNPHFFAYGSLPIYTIYFTGLLINFFSHLLAFRSASVGGSIPTVPFEQAILISRFYSALFSTLLIPLLFVIARKFTLSEVEGRNDSVGLIASFFASVSVGFIQFAHFGTFEMWLTFFSTVLLWLCLKLLESGKKYIVFFLGVTLGILVATKVSHLVLLSLPILALLFQKTQGLFKRPKIPVNDKKKFDIRYSNLIKDILLFLLITIIVFFITNPFVLLDYSSFIGSMKYESEVALGTLSVFYTGEFRNSLPIVFQFLHVYPFLINPLLTALFIPSFFYLLSISIKRKSASYLILNTFYIILFLSQVFLYAKWTRYMVPTLPFIYLICAIAFADFLKFKTFYSSRERSESRSSNSFVLSIIFGTSILFAASYIITAFFQEDTRIAAKNYALQNVPPNASILSEVYDLGITPFNGSYSNIALYNFYDLDNNSLQYIPRTDYIILPSQRILKTRLQDAKAYPNGHIFYSALLQQASGFQKIYETPCDLFCRITYMGNPVYSFEETANVFDRPTVFIFKKISNL